jgi:hypothetical protein
MLSALKRVVVSCVLITHCLLYTASTDVGEYKIAPEQVARFLSASAEGAFQLKTAYAHETTVSLFIHSEKKSLSTMPEFDTFSDALLKKTIQNIAYTRRPLTPEDVLEVVQPFSIDFSKYNMSCLLLATDGNVIAVQARTKLFTPEPWSAMKYHQLSDKIIRIAFSTNAPFTDQTLQITEDAQTDFDLVPDAPEKIATNKNNGAINLLFNPTQWHKETVFEPFIKPVLSYPFICAESIHGFKRGILFGLSAEVLIELFARYTGYISDYANKDRFVARKWPSLWALITLVALSQIATSEDRQAYRRFYNNEKKITGKLYSNRDTPLSQRIFDIAALCRASKQERACFDSAYRTLIEKVKRGEPYNEQEEDCDRILSWRREPYSDGSSVYIPVHKTRRIHNQLYKEAITGIRRVRDAEGFAAGVCFSMLCLALLQSTAT